MPFTPGFQKIDRICCRVASDCGLAYVRGDRHHRPGPVLAQIVNEIKRAAVVIADISDENPNVFYELGIAHEVLGHERVVIIRQRPDKPTYDPPYDVQQFRHLVYTHDNAGQRRLRNELFDYLSAAIEARADNDVWTIIRGRLPRTRVIVGDLERRVESSGSKRFDSLVIRIIAGLGSLAISDHEKPDPELGEEYTNNLIKERDLIRKALVLGARMKAILNPPRRFARGMLPDRLRIRYKRLIGLLEGRSDITDDRAAVRADLLAIKRCEFALTPVPMTNLLIINHEIAYEGLKRGITGGFGMTHCETDVNEIHRMIGEFDESFEESRDEMIRAHPPDGRLVEQLRAFLDEANATSK